ncbi:MAG: FAD-binding protein [Kiritimatiellia bacterium]
MHEIVADYAAPSGVYARIDTFADSQPHPIHPALLADFLKTIGLELTLDADILAGYLHDSSNLPARAEALARPQSTAECALFLHAYSRAGLPVTVSGGRSNLTGSATAEGGVLLSLSRMLAPDPAIDAAAATVRTRWRHGFPRPDHRLGRPLWRRDRRRAHPPARPERPAGPVPVPARRSQRPEAPAVPGRPVAGRPGDPRRWNISASTAGAS